MVTAFGAWLNATRRGARLSMRELGERAGFTAGYISKLELGRITPKREIVLAFAQALGQPSADGLRAAGYQADSAEITPEGLEFDYLIRRVAPAHRRQVMNAVRSVAELASARQV